MGWRQLKIHLLWKKVVFLLGAIFLTTVLFAQTDKKDDKQLTKEVKEKAVRNARRDAKKWRKIREINGNKLDLDVENQKWWKTNS